MENSSLKSALLPKPSRDREELEPWENPGWASVSRLNVIRKPKADPNGDASSNDKQSKSRSHSTAEEHHEHPKLGELAATAICGNDITSSCLYTAGLCAAASGVYAPISLYLVVIMLYFFRFVYGEVGTALPLNGGAYNVLLNTTSKSTASIAACLTILSYVATGVVSAAEACFYLSNLWTDMNIFIATILLLSAFALLNLMGITESAFVAAIIFVFHITTLTILIISSVVFLASNGLSIYTVNYQSPLQPDIGRSLFYGFSAASLGISGFETSANFIEEQKEGVFPRTLRNMWIGTFVFNPLLSLLSGGIVPITEVLDPKKQAVWLATMGRITAGRWLEVVVSLDAFLVLSGAVITAYVGVTGLIKRLTGDRCLPGFLLQENKWRGTNHWIILAFLGICISMYTLLDGDVDQLSAVYSITFLSVMMLFALGDMLLKFKRNAIPRQVRSTWATTISAFILVGFALVATAFKDPETINYFVIYFLCTASIFAITFWRIQLLKIALYSMRRLFRNSARFRACCDRFITQTIRNINQQSVVFFAKTDSISMLNKAILYVRSNEHTHWVRIVHCTENEEDIPKNLISNCELLNSAYPKIRVDCVILQGEFGRSAIDAVQREFNVPRNMMFITCPSETSKAKISSLGGVRVITHHQKAKPAKKEEPLVNPASLREPNPPEAAVEDEEQDGEGDDWELDEDEATRAAVQQAVLRSGTRPPEIKRGSLFGDLMVETKANIVERNKVGQMPSSRAVGGQFSGVVIAKPSGPTVGQGSGLTSQQNSDKSVQNKPVLPPLSSQSSSGDMSKASSQSANTQTVESKANHVSSSSSALSSEHSVPGSEALKPVENQVSAPTVHAPSENTPDLLTGDLQQTISSSSNEMSSATVPLSTEQSNTIS